MFSRGGLTALVAAGVLAAAMSAASAKPARCFTTDDGYFDCDFTTTDRRGSFEISGADVPTYTIEVDRPGFAYGYANFGDRNVALPGMFVRQRDDGACWANPETDVKICAW